MRKATNTCFVFMLTQFRLSPCARGRGESWAVTSHSVTSWPSEGSGQEGPGSRRRAGRAC